LYVLQAYLYTADEPNKKNTEIDEAKEKTEQFQQIEHKRQTKKIFFFLLLFFFFCYLIERKNRIEGIKKQREYIK
jgi:flagellar biogenesis protein FliO